MIKKYINFILLFALFVLTSCRQALITPSQTSTIYPITATVIPSSTLDFANNPNWAEFQNGTERGNPIVLGIDEFFQDKGHYPNSLDDLVPNYINAIPLTLTGQEFYYHLAEPNTVGETYILGFNLAEKPNTTCVYQPRYQEWECGPILVP